MIELLKTRRSIRKYEDREVEKEKIDILLKAALLAPTSMNKKSWEFISVNDKDLIKKLSKSKEYGSKLLEGAPFCIVVIGDKERSDVWIEDASIASAVIHLTAHSIGLGSCWVQIRKRAHSNEEIAEDYVKKVLNIPDKYGVLSIIPIGYPAEDKKAYEESDLLYDKIHLNGYENK